MATNDKTNIDADMKQLADTLIQFYENGYSVGDGQAYTVGEILTYYIDKIVQLEIELEELQDKIERIKSKYIKKKTTEVDKEWQWCSRGYNSALDSVLQDLDMHYYLNRSDEEREQYY